MATKAELLEELEDLRAKLAETRKTKSSPGAETGEPPDDDPPNGDERMSQLGDLETLWPEISEELERFQQHYPRLTIVGAFAAGFLLGRTSK
ncbi:hypothetical protein [Roseibium sp. RKSG952]|uniref:hypothetical protein n=1 Tax=Roseibium sp. RKSG952 TaxID=2529384 RepID=UPI0012BC78C5|nr:hypothetical protein [Roseibium sp. RKSG952]MTI01018.1 hypothetical protein [Roseibium sp. RKSG952]